MGKTKRFLGELARRNVWRAGLLYVGATWALAQGIAQLAPALGLPEVATRWFMVAAAIGFPFWIAFAWFYEFTPAGLKRESEVVPGESIARTTGRKLDFAIIGVLAVAVVLLLTDRVVHPRGANATHARSIAVLPFENLSDDKGGEYFVAGMQGEILTRLANFGGLKVVSRTSTEKYRSHAENLREVGRELGVTAIVEGSVQRAGDKVRIAVQLIDAGSDTHLWAQSYDREMRDVFAVQSDVAGKIASALQLKLQPDEALALAPTNDPAAYDLFLRAEYLANRGSADYDTAVLKQSLVPYRQAIARDPSFALALARLSIVQSTLVWFGAYSIAYRTGDPARALAVLRGNHPSVQLMRVELLRMLRRYPQALAVLEPIPDTPDNFGGQAGASKASYLGTLYEAMGDTARARQSYARAEVETRAGLARAEAAGDRTTLVIEMQNMVDVELGLGRIDAAVRLADRTQSLIEGLGDEYLNLLLSGVNATFYARAGRADQAVRLLDRVLGSPSGGWAYAPALLSVEPSWDAIRKDPRFIALQQKYPAASVEDREAGKRGEAEGSR